VQEKENETEFDAKAQRSRKVAILLAALRDLCALPETRV
jgi:hypothetical protein